MKRHPEVRKVFKRLFSILLILVMVLSFTACAAGPSSQEIVDGVIEALDDIKTYQFDMDMTLDIATEAEGEAFEVTMVLSSSGAFDLENRQMSMDMTVSTVMFGEAMEASGEMYLIGDMMYAGMEIPEIGPVWTKSEMPVGYWEEMNQVKAQIEFVEAAQVEVIGSEKVKGVDCYVLQLTPDMEQLWQLAMQQSGVTGEEILPDVDAEFLQEMFQSFSVKQWIAKDTYLLTKVEIDMAVELTPEALGFPEEEGLMTMDITIVLLAYDYNQPVSIILPQEAEEALVRPPFPTTTITVTEPATTVIEPSLLIIDTYFDVDEEIVTIVGKEFAIALYSVQRFNMYRWDVSYDEEMVALSERTWKAYEGQFIADEGKEWFIFKALKDGTTEITFTYIQSSSESVIEEKVFKIDIRIR